VSLFIESLLAVPLLVLRPCAQVGLLRQTAGARACMDSAIVTTVLQISSQTSKRRTAQCHAPVKSHQMRPSKFGRKYDVVRTCEMQENLGICALNRVSFKTQKGLKSLQSRFDLTIIP